MDQKDLDKEHEIVRKLIKPGTPVDFTYFVGYLGKSTFPNHIRLYLSLTFDEFLDIPKDKILHHADVPEEILAFGGTCVWIPRDVEVIHTRNELTKMQAQFLEGEIMQTYGDIEEEPWTSMKKKPRSPLCTPSRPKICEPSYIKCPTVGCPSRLGCTQQ